MNRWTDDEKNEVRAVYAQHGTAGCVLALKRHSKQAIRSFASVDGLLIKGRLFTEDEKNDIRKNYPIYGTFGCHVCKANGRNAKSITHKAKTMLIFRSERRHNILKLKKKKAYIENKIAVFERQRDRQLENLAVVDAKLEILWKAYEKAEVSSK